MDNLQKAKLSSYNLMIAVADNHSEVVAMIPLFADGMKQLKSMVNEIVQQSVLQGKDLTGITKGKNDYLDQCKALLLEVAGAIHTIAIKTGNMALQSLTDYPKGKINKLDQRDTVSASRAVLAEARKLPLDDLVVVGLKSEDLDSFELVIDGLDGRLDSRKEAGIDQSSVTKHIADLFEQAQVIKVDILDKLAPQFQRKAPDFFEKYKAASTVAYKRTAKKDDKGTEEENK